MSYFTPVSPHNVSQIAKPTDNLFQVVKKDEENVARICLAINILLYLPIRDHERDEFMEFFQSNYQNSNLSQQCLEFRNNYRPDEAIQWFTRPSGIPSKLVNAICRTQNPILISKLRYYLKHLHEQVRQLYIKSLIWIPNSIIVYRGQRFSSEEFERLVRSKDKTILATTFLSTTGADDVATVFSGYRTRTDKSSSNEISVIFKILIITETTRLKPFAYIQEYSHIRDEKEIIISIGTVFLLKDVQKREGNYYEVFLIHGHDEEEIEKEMLDNAIKSYDKGTTMTMNEFLDSMKIDSTLCGDFSGLPLGSFLEELSQPRSMNTVNSASMDFPMATLQNSTMNLIQDHLIIWLDQYIGQVDTCTGWKEKLFNATNITIDNPLVRNEVDRLILNNTGRTQVWNSLITATTVKQCLSLINTHNHKKIFLITSGILGSQLIPRVVEHYPYVEKIYIFCHNICTHIDWAMDYTDSILMFNFDTDLFARVTYDIGMSYMQQGIVYSRDNDHTQALNYLFTAKKLVMRANNIFHPYFPFTLTNIDKSIIQEEQLLPIDSVQHILSNLSLC